MPRNPAAELGILDKKIYSIKMRASRTAYDGASQHISGAERIVPERDVQTIAASLLERGQAGGIAWWAHVGGFIAGMALCGLFAKRRRTPRRRERYTHDSEED